MQLTPLPPNTVHQTLMTAMFHKSICRRCNKPVIAASHTLEDCEAAQQAQAIAADLALNHNKAERMNKEASRSALKLQRQWEKV